MRLIDADKILEALGVFTDKEQGDPHFLAAIASAREIIEGMPEAVVRCKDCRYWKDQAEGVVEVPVCEYDCRNGKIGIAQIMGAEDYCSRGERKAAESE